MERAVNNKVTEFTGFFGKFQIEQFG